MASKSFGTTPETRRPRAVINDAAYAAARNAFDRLADEPAPPPSAPIVAASAPPALVVAPPPPLPKIRQPEKMSVYPSIADRERLARIKAAYRVGESFVVEYALERLFAEATDEDIAAEIRRRGHTLRRAR